MFPIQIRHSRLSGQTGILQNLVYLGFVKIVLVLSAGEGTAKWAGLNLSSFW